MNIDMTVPCADGIINIRVGAIIMKNGKLLMVGGDGPDYLVSVGGRVKFGETAEEAIIREVEEETGVRLEIDRLVFVHENYYYGDVPAKQDKLVYELSFFFLMKVPDTFEPSHLVDESLHDDDCHHRKKVLIILDTVYFKDNEAFTEQVDILFGVEQEVKTASVVILPQSSQEVVNVEILLIDGDRTLRHFSAILVTHKLIERVEARNYVLILSHYFKEHRQRRA